MIDFIKLYVLKDFNFCEATFDLGQVKTNIQYMTHIKSRMLYSFT